MYNQLVSTRTVNSGICPVKFSHSHNNRRKGIHYMSKPKILIVDDAAFMRMMVKNTLNENGYTDTYEASDGAEAVNKYAEIQPDLVIMDITMPNMDGLEALKAIRKADPNASVVMCSAMGQEAMVIEAIKSGAKDFIVKPFKPDRIIKTVSSIVGQP